MNAPEVTASDLIASPAQTTLPADNAVRSEESHQPHPKQPEPKAMNITLNQPRIYVIAGPDLRELLAEITEAIRDGRAIVTTGEPVESHEPPSHPGIVKALPSSSNVVQLVRRSA